MKWILIAVGILVGIVVLCASVGAMLPASHEAKRTLTIARPPEDIWQTVTDFENQPSWRSDLESVKRLPDRDGHEMWQEEYKSGDRMTLETGELQRPRRLVRHIADIGGPFSGRWEYEIAPAGEGSRLTITEIGKVPNPIFRFVSRYVIGHTRYLDIYLRALAARFGEEPRIE